VQAVPPLRSPMNALTSCSFPMSKDRFREGHHLGSVSISKVEGRSVSFGSVLLSATIPKLRICEIPTDADTKMFEKSVGVNNLVAF